MPFKGGQRPLLQSQPSTNNCETPQTRAQESFGLILTSPEDVERNDAKREKGASIWRLPGPTSPKNREQREPNNIAVTSSFPALKMPKSPRIRVPGAFGAESVCYGYIGGGDVPTTKSDGGFLSSPKDRHVHYTTNPGLAARRYACSYSLCFARISSTGCELRCRTLSAMLPYTSLSNPVLP